MSEVRWLAKEYFLCTRQRSFNEACVRIRNMGRETKRTRERDTREGRGSFLPVFSLARFLLPCGQFLFTSWISHAPAATSLGAKQQIVTYFYLYIQRTSLLIALIRMRGAAPQRKHVSMTAWGLRQAEKKKPNKNKTRLLSFVFATYANFVVIVLSLLYLGVKAQNCFLLAGVAVSLDKKTLLKSWLNPRLQFTIFRGTGPWFW